MGSFSGGTMKKMDIFGKKFQICTIAGYVAYINKIERKTNENDSQSLISTIQANIFIRHKNFDILELITISSPFNGNIDDRVVITCIKNENNEKLNISLVNIDSGQSLTFNNINNFLRLIDKVEKLKMITLEGLLGFSMAIFLYHSLCIEGSYKVDGTITCYCIAVMLYFIMSMCLKMNMKRKRSSYACLIQKNIEFFSEQINCPIRYKFSETK